MSDLHELRVGQLYIPGRTSYPEAVQYNYRSGGHELLMWLANPRESEVEAVRAGPCQFALLTWRDVIFFLYRFEHLRGGIPWSDAPFSIHLVPPDQRTLPAPLSEIAHDPDEARALLQIILVDAGTGIVRALRAVTLSPAFTAALHAAIRAQAERPWPGDAAYDAQIQAAYAAYPSTRQMVKAAQSRTKGGA